MKMTVTPSALELARGCAKSSSTSWGTSTAVGSSRMRIAGAPVEDLEDLDPLAVADAEVLDQPSGSTRRP